MSRQDAIKALGQLAHDTPFNQNRAERRKLARKIRKAPGALKALQESLQRRPAHEIGAMTCGTCRRAVAECVCLDRNGQPLDWGAVRPKIRIDYGALS